MAWVRKNSRGNSSWTFPVVVVPTDVALLCCTVYLNLLVWHRAVDHDFRLLVPITASQVQNAPCRPESSRTDPDTNVHSPSLVDTKVLL
jgi:hypothetical protein